MRAPAHDGEWTQQHVIKTHRDEKDHKFCPFFALVKQIHSSFETHETRKLQNLKNTQKLLVSL
jgi:hypothetical protein